MNLSNAYSDVIRCGRLHPEEVKKWVDISNDYATKNNTHSGASDGSHPDYALVDMLEDAGDPRSHILKKDLQIRQRPLETPAEHFGDKVWAKEKELLGSYPNASVFIDKLAPDVEARQLFNTDEPDKHIYKVIWRQPSTERSFGLNIVGHFLPEEFEELKSQFENETN
jgi:hypothetical protein